MKIHFYPVNKSTEVMSGANLLQVMLANDFKIRSVCRGRGICATCSVRIRGNAGAVTPMTAQEKKTLSLMVNSSPDSRLACQCRILADGVTVELPQGIYVEKLEELLNLVGEESVADYLHPLTGAVMIPKNKVITRSQLQAFKNLHMEVDNVAN